MGGNLTADGELRCTWVKTTDITDLGNTADKVAVINQENWIYYRTMSELLKDMGINDYIVEQGTSGIWYYRKWSSGTAECYGTLSTVPHNCPGYNGFDVSLPFTFSNTSYTVVVQPTINGHLASYHAIMNGSGNNSKTTTKFILSYDYTVSTTYQVLFDIHVFGRWK